MGGTKEMCGDRYRKHTLPTVARGVLRGLYPAHATYGRKEGEWANGRRMQAAGAKAARLRIIERNFNRPGSPERDTTGSRHERSATWRNRLRELVGPMMADRTVQEQAGPDRRKRLRGMQARCEVSATASRARAQPFRHG